MKLEARYRTGRGPWSVWKSWEVRDNEPVSRLFLLEVHHVTVRFDDGETWQYRKVVEK